MKKLTIKEFIEKANKVHNNKYDYSFVEYINMRTKVKIICPIHGIFEMQPGCHLSGQGCPECSGKKRYTQKEWIERASKIHNNKYDYSLVEYKGQEKKVKIICPIHGMFEQKAMQHTNSLNGCPLCRESHGEKEINQILIEKNINFLRQKKFKECKNQQELPFDFYLPEHNICIEYQGEQHYKPMRYSRRKEINEYNFYKIQITDKIKKDFCIKNNIRLIEITYKENIKGKLEEMLKCQENEHSECLQIMQKE
ncbi:MAG: DUF723 domain-containing protein [Elusimicrobiota bacterium]|jgi:very-short-patch-repair endonuclease|nr:DUF723 domain-containing protein [Elusimicrobiota bacterium]